MMCSDLPIKLKNNNFKNKVINWDLSIMLFTFYALIKICDYYF